MKKFETLVKEAEKKSAELEKNNEVFTVADSCAIAMSKEDILNLLVYVELKKALENKNTRVILDCDFSKSRTRADNKDTSFNYVHIVSNDKNVDNKLQLKFSKNKLHFNVSTKLVDVLAESETVKYKRDKNNKVKNIRVNCTYENVVDTFKTISALMNTEK